MIDTVQIFFGGKVFDGESLHEDAFVAVENGVLTEIGPAAQRPHHGMSVDLKGDILSIGYVDLQVNGGGGVMLNAQPTPDTLFRMAKAHRGLGVTQMLPTLITDTPDTTRAAIAAAIKALEMEVPGIAGLHLEGPHLSVERKGAHDAKRIRPMEEGDLDQLLQAATQLPCLKVTIAPENVTDDQVRRLSDAGILVSLGHTDADYETCLRYFDAGARCVTHLFNAMSQIGNRAPGLVGAAIARGAVSAGLIADGIHVHTEVMRMAWQAKRGPGQIFLVSDAMAVAGTQLTAFELGGREIRRNQGQLRLADGTLAGADLSLATAISTLVNAVGVDLEEALRAAISAPADLCNLQAHRLRKNVTPMRDIIRIKADLSGAQPLDETVLNTQTMTS